MGGFFVFSHRMSSYGKGNSMAACERCGTFASTDCIRIFGTDLGL